MESGWALFTFSLCVGEEQMGKGQKNDYFKLFQKLGMGGDQIALGSSEYGLELGK